MRGSTDGVHKRCPGNVLRFSKHRTAAARSATQFSPRRTPRATVVRYIFQGGRPRGPWHLERQYVEFGS